MNNTPEKRVETPRTDAELTRIEDDEKQYEDRYDCYIAMLSFARQLEQELQQAQQKIDEHNWNQMAWEENQELLAKTTTQLQQAREELARLQEAINLASASQIFKREEELLSQLSQWQEFNSRLTKLLVAAEGDDLIEVDATIIKQRDQWQECAKKMANYASHFPTCPMPMRCDCGLPELIERIEKLSTPKTTEARKEGSETPKLQNPTGK